MSMQILRDARLGLRLLWRQPTFTTVALLALALGVAANTAIFSVVHATLLAPLPYDNPDELVIVWSRIQNNRNSTAAGDYLDWVRLSRSFQGLHAWSRRQREPLRGRPVRSGDGEAWHAGLSDHAWVQVVHGARFPARRGDGGEGPRRRHDARVLARLALPRDPAILGRQIRVDGKPHTVVGVLAPGVPDRLESKLFLPLAFKPEQLNHDFHWLLVLGRLKPGVTLAQANADMVAVTKRSPRSHPSSNTGWSASVEPLKNNFLGAEPHLDALAAARRGRLRPADRLRERREPAARARDRPAARSGGPLCARRVARRLSLQFLVESVVLATTGGSSASG